MKECEDCGDIVKRRIRCYHCGLLVCGWCWNHVHRCEPGHKKENCYSFKAYKKYGQKVIKQLRLLMIEKGKLNNPHPLRCGDNSASASGCAKLVLSRHH